MWLIVNPDIGSETLHLRLSRRVDNLNGHFYRFRRMAHRHADNLVPATVCILYKPSPHRGISRIGAIVIKGDYHQALGIESE